MSDDSRRGRTRRRGLSADERKLWDDVTQSVKPLRRLAHSENVSVAEEPKPAAPIPEAVPSPPAIRKPAPAPTAPPLASLGRRERQRVARGSIEIDARIDLHGMTQERAHRRLVSFLRAAQSDGAKLVLVITGKGARGEGSERERGVLRRMVPQWLALPELRAVVVGFEPAHIAHGGEGALYVRVRRGR